MKRANAPIYSPADAEKAEATQPVSKKRKLTASASPAAFEAALAAFEVVEARYNETYEKQSRLNAAVGERPVVEPPAILTVHLGPVTMIFDGETRTSKGTTYTYRNRREIEEADRLDPAQKVEMLEALAAHEAAQAEADKQSGYADRLARFKEAEARWEDSLRLAWDAGLAVLRVPAVGARAKEAKEKILKEFFPDPDDSVVEALLQAASADPEVLPPAPEVVALWNERIAALEAARAEDARKHQRYREADAAVEAAAPIPEVLKLGKSLLTTEAMIDHAEVPLARKVEMFAALRDWIPIRDAARRDAGLYEANDAWDEDALPGAENTLIEATPPDAAALAEQLLIVAARHVEQDAEKFATVEGFAAALSSGCRDEVEITRLCQNALRLAGTRPELVAAKPFDVEAWIDAFEAHPGHIVTQGGRVEYQEPMAWGAPGEAELLISDPDAIERYNAWVRSHYSDEDWAKSERAGTVSWVGKPFMPAQIEAIHAAYPDGPERDRLVALWELRQERLTGEPLGAHLWRDLADWQKDAVRAYCRAHPLPFPARWRWDASEWLNAFEEAGGVIVRQADGGFMAGAGVPGTFETRRLMRHLDERLRAEVADLLKSRDHLRDAQTSLLAAE